MTYHFSMLKIAFLGAFLFGITACQSQTNNGTSAPANVEEVAAAVQMAPRDLQPAEFRNLVDRTPDHVILDVRTETERLQTGFMLDSKNLDFYNPNFSSQLNELDPNKTYFVYCRSGQRSGNTVDQLRAKGIKAYNLKGGFMAWKEVFPF